MKARKTLDKIQAQLDEARANGQHPVTEFRRIYDIPYSVFKTLVRLQVIRSEVFVNSDKFHHLVKFFNWDEKTYYGYYQAHRTEIVRLVREIDAAWKEYDRQDMACKLGKQDCNTVDHDAIIRKENELRDLFWNIEE